MGLKEFDSDKFSQDLINLRGEESRDSFAKKLNIDVSTLSLLESGIQVPKVDILKDFCKLSGKDTSNYFDDTMDSFIYAMASLDKHDRAKFKETLEKISIKEKYEALARRNKE